MLKPILALDMRQDQSALDGIYILFNRTKPKTVPLSEQDDAQLVRCVLAGDKKAYEIIVRRYQKLVYNVVFQMIRSHETACDLTQDTFLKAYRALSTFRHEARFKPWLLRIATNSCLNLIRDSKEYDSLEAALEENPQKEPASGQDLEEEIEWRLTQQMLDDALTVLSPRHRHVFVLRYQHDLSYEDIAETVGEPVTTIKSLLFRIRDKLRRILSEKIERDNTLERKEVTLDHGQRK